MDWVKADKTHKTEKCTRYMDSIIQQKCWNFIIFSSLQCDELGAVLVCRRQSKNWANLYKNWIQRCPPEDLLSLFRQHFSSSFSSLHFFSADVLGAPSELSLDSRVNLFFVHTWKKLWNCIAHRLICSAYSAALGWCSQEKFRCFHFFRRLPSSTYMYVIAARYGVRGEMKEAHRRAWTKNCVWKKKF